MSVPKRRETLIFGAVSEDPAVDPLEKSIAIARMALAVGAYARWNEVCPRSSVVVDAFDVFEKMQPKRANGIQFGLGRTCTKAHWKRWAAEALREWQQLDP